MLTRRNLLRAGVTSGLGLVVSSWLERVALADAAPAAGANGTKGATATKASVAMAQAASSLESFIESPFCRFKRTGIV